MRRWKPKRGLGLWIGLLLLILCLMGGVMVGTRLFSGFWQPPEQWDINLMVYGDLVTMVALILLVGMLLYRVIGALTLSYEMDRNGLYIVWIGNRAVVPLSQVESVESNMAGLRIPLSFLRNIGYYAGRGRTADGRLLHLFTTARPSRSLVIHTADQAYAIAPADKNTFVQELEQRRRLGAVKALNPTVEPGRIFFYAFWNDAVVRWALVLTFGLNLVLLGIVAARYPELANLLEMRFNAAGQTTELRPRHQVLFLPLAAFVLSLLNTGLGLSFYRRDKTSAQLLQVGSVVIQILFGVAILTIIAT